MRYSGAGDMEKCEQKNCCYAGNNCIIVVEKQKRSEYREEKVGTNMDPIQFTAEQMAKLKSCKDSSEIQSMLNEMGIELTDEQLEAAVGGGVWQEDRCARFVDCWIL